MWNNIQYFPRGLTHCEIFCVHNANQILFLWIVNNMQPEKTVPRRSDLPKKVYVLLGYSQSYNFYFFLKIFYFYFVIFVKFEDCRLMELVDVFVFISFVSFNILFILQNKVITYCKWYTLTIDTKRNILKIKK